MGSSFSKSKNTKKTEASKVTEVDRQVLGLKTQRRKLVGYATRVARQIEKETRVATGFAKLGMTQKALNALRKRKLLEGNAQRIDQWLFSIEELLGGIEQAQATGVVLSRLKQGNEALKTAQSGYGVDEVFRVLRDMEEGAERETEINQMLGERLDTEAEGAALAELEALELEETFRKTAPVPVVGSESIPTVDTVPGKADAEVPVGETSVPVETPVQTAVKPAADDVETVKNALPAAPTALPKAPSANPKKQKEKEKSDRTLVPAS
jgi:hypothetical protein